MIYRLTLLACALLAITGCDKKGNTQLILPDGAYSGTYRSTAPGQNAKVAHVDLNLYNGNYNGTTDISYYPAICSSTFTYGHNTITFKDDCIWPAIASLAPLAGTYDVSLKGDSIILSRATSSNNAVLLTLVHKN